MCSLPAMGYDFDPPHLHSVVMTDLVCAYPFRLHFRIFPCPEVSWEPHTKHHCSWSSLTNAYALTCCNALYRRQCIRRK